MNTVPTHPSRSRWWLWIVLALGTVALIVGMGRALNNRQAKQQALQQANERLPSALFIPASEWLTVQARTLQLAIPITGSLSAVDSALVKARVPGELRGLQVREGDTVTQGQVIARIDPTEADARYRQTKLQADAAQAQVAITQRQYDNNRALVDKGFISATALSTSQANLQAAQANYAAARAAQDGARKSLDDTVLRSPIAGHIARRMVQNAERVNVEAPIVEVVNLSALELLAQLPANDSARVQVGQRATLQLDGSIGDKSAQLSAQVVRINPSASAGNRAVPVYLRLDPVPGAITLRPGMYVQGSIHTGSVTAVAVPLSSIRTDQPLPYVQLVHNAKVLHQQIVMGVQSTQDGQTWVAVQGLSEGSQILSSQVGAVPSGAAVQLAPTMGAAAAAPSSPQ